MLPTFEKETHELTEHEYNNILPIVIERLSLNVGKANQRTNRHIRTALEKNYGYLLTDSRFRKIVQHIRVWNLIPGLVANSNGYYVANSKAEIDDYIVTANKRIRSLIATRDSFTKRLEML